MKVLVGFLTETAFCCALLYGIGFSSDASFNASSSNSRSPVRNLDLKKDQADAEFVLHALERCYAITEVAKLGKVVSRTPAVTREAETILSDYTMVIERLKAVGERKNLCIVISASENKRGHVTALHEETPDKFDAAWRSAVASMNTQLIRQFETYPHAPDEVLQPLFTASLPVLRKRGDTFKTLIAEDQADQ